MARLGGDKSNYVLQVYVNGNWNDVGLTSTAYMDSENAINEFGTVFPTYTNFKVVDETSKYAAELKDGSDNTIAYFVTPEKVQEFVAQYSPFAISVDGDLLTITYTTPSAPTTETTE